MEVAACTAWSNASSTWPAAAGAAADEGTGELLVVNAGDGRVTLEWDASVVTGAREAGHVLDANGYLAPTSVLNTATEDD